ncbi:MAG: BACON domain-containing carbohydrate-binding protein [Candidatus Cloacimonetes bacterium]|nr:BACON domain-containing carbohydrate-binding protein [Candidatus Cloacimonadota bacterium]
MSGSNSMTLTVTYQANPLTTTRIGQIIVTGGGLTQAITVTQDAAPLFLTVDPLTINCGADSCHTDVTIQSNITWHVSESPYWITINQTTGINNETITLSISKNTDANPRAAQVLISGQGLTQTINVVQHVSVSNEDEFNIVASPYLKAYPNPFNALVSIEIGAKGMASSEISVYSIKGQKVKTLGRVSKGVSQLHWDGKDKNGIVCPSGCYMIRSTDKSIQPQKIIFLRK